MGCGSSKDSSAGETKGTTLVGLWYKGGILIAADSRSSNERLRNKALRINNHVDKMYKISSNIIAVMSGTAIDCRDMCDKVRTACETEFEKNGESVDYALRKMCAHLRALPAKIKNDKAFGVLMAGWDEQNGLQLYRIFIMNGQVTNQQIRSGCTTLGSGSKYAESILQYRYEFDVMDGDQAAEVALEVLFNSTFFDKSTGGDLRRYKIEKGKPIITMDKVDPFDVPNPVVRSRFESLYYTLREYEPRILFVIYSSTFPIRTFKLVDHFKSQYGGRDAVEAIAAHLVVQKQDFYFHRVVFKSEEDASTVWNNVKKNSQQASHDDTFNLLQHFPYRSQLVFESEESALAGVTDVLLYVNKSSEHLLQLICNSN